MLQLGAALSLVLSMQAGALVSTSSISTHWLLDFVPIRGRRRKLAILSLLPVVMAFLAWPLLASHAGLLPKAVVILWNILVMRTARSLYQAPFCFPDSLPGPGDARSARAKKKDAPVRGGAMLWGRLRRSFGGGWELRLVLGLVIPAIALLFLLIMAWDWSLALWGLERTIDLCVALVLLFTVALALLGRSFPLREYRMLPITARWYTVSWMTYFCVSTLPPLILAAFSLFAAFRAARDGSIVLSAVQAMPLFVSCSVLLLGHALMRVKLPVVLFVGAIAITVCYCIPSTPIALTVTMALLPLLVLAIGFRLEVRVITHSRAAYFRRSDLEEFGKVEWDDIVE